MWGNFVSFLSQATWWYPFLKLFTFRSIAVKWRMYSRLERVERMRSYGLRNNGQFKFAHFSFTHLPAERNGFKFWWEANYVLFCTPDDVYMRMIETLWLKCISRTYPLLFPISKGSTPYCLGVAILSFSIYQGNHSITEHKNWRSILYIN